MFFSRCQLLLITVLFIAAGCSSTKQTFSTEAHEIMEVNASEIPKGNTTIAIIHAIIIDGNGGEPITDGTVIVENGKIIAKGISVAVAKNAVVVDASGMSLLPGFIDAHFHLDGEHGLPAKFLQNGVTSVRDPGAWIEMYSGERNDGKAVPRLFLSGPHIDMFPPAYPNDAYIVRDADEAIRQVNKMADSGATMIKVYFRLPPSIIRAVCETAHGRGIPVSAHLETTEAMEAIDAGVDGIEHITSFGLSLQSKIMGEKYRRSVLADNNARKDGRYEVWNRIDVNGKMADTLAAFLKRKGTFVSATLGAFEYQFPNKGEAGKPDSVKWNAFKNMKAMTGKLKKSGVAMVVGSHSMIPYAELGWAFQREMELLSASGFTNSEIIVAATMENARYFRIEKKLGSIDVGKMADLILVKGNPLVNISDSKNVSAVMLNGIWVKQ